MLSVGTSDGVQIKWLSITGGTSGVLVAQNIDVIVPFIENLLGVQFLAKDIYLNTTIPSDLRWADVWTIGAMTVALAMAFGMAPSAVLERIRKLEESLGVLLFHRSRSGCEPTPAALATAWLRGNSGGDTFVPFLYDLGTTVYNDGSTNIGLPRSNLLTSSPTLSFGATGRVSPKPWVSMRWRFDPAVTTV